MEDFPCKDCLVLPMCKQRIKHSLTELYLQVRCRPLEKFVKLTRLKNLNDARLFLGLPKTNYLFID